MDNKPNGQTNESCLLSSELVKVCQKLPAAVLADAMGRTGCMDSGIKPLTPSARMAGPALTVRCYPGDNLMCHYALQMAQPGDILVVDGSGYTEGALWGGLLSLSARQRKLGGTVVDGAARDCDDIRQLGYPVYARSLTPRGVFKTMKGEINVAINCGGVAVQPGDLIVGDENGIVVVPRSQAVKVVEDAIKVIEKENGIAAEIEKGKTIYEILSLNRYFEE